MKDGGPAFPCEIKEFELYDHQTYIHACQFQPNPPKGEWVEKKYRGISMRDWFAGQALAGLTAHLGCVGDNEPKQTVEEAYGIADAMLAAREEKS